jgi:hypothetical protein
MMSWPVTCMLVWKESCLNRDGHQFYQYQPSEHSPLILSKLTEHKNTTAYDVGNPGLGLGQAQTNDNKFGT